MDITMIKFLSHEQEERFQQLYSLFQEKPSKSTIAGLFVLSGMHISLERMTPYVSYDRMDYETLKHSFPFSTGEKVLIELAQQFFGGKHASPVTVEEVFGTLDEEYKNLVLEAIKLRYF